MEFFDTIAAIATPPGNGAIGIVRLSGPGAHAVADAVFRAESGEMIAAMKGYTARLGKIENDDGIVLDECVALCYRAPRSYTGEDAVELMCHGGEVVCGEVLRLLCSHGAGAAAPGEFTRRALMNGRLTLTQAEAVCDVINAASAQGSLAAAALQDGALYRSIAAQKEEILALQAQISAAVDFPEEDVEEIDADRLLQQLDDLSGRLRALLDRYDMGASVLRGVPAVIVGSPNVGKSTLLNLLAGAPSALVTPVAGTTRDIIERQVRLGGATLLLADTAGIRDSDDLVEQAGIERALKRVDGASLVLAVFDGSRPLGDEDQRVMALVKDKRVLAVVNKTDLPGRLEQARIAEVFEQVVYISANDVASLGELDRAVARAVRLDELDPSQPVLANERQRGCALEALEALDLALEALRGGALDALSMLLSEALAALGELSGENMTEALLDQVFSRFCVGK